MFNDKKFFERLKKKDPNVIEDIYNEYKTFIYNYLLVKTRNNLEVANDVLSETFCSIMTSIDKIKNLKNLRSYLIQIANRRLSDYLRKMYHDKNYEKYFDVNEKIEDTVIEDLHIKEQLLKVNLAMDNLKPLFKTVLKLKYFEEKTQEEIAVLIHKTVSSVETLLVRARKQLKIELKKIKGFINDIR